MILPIKGFILLLTFFSSISFRTRYKITHTFNFPSIPYTNRPHPSHRHRTTSYFTHVTTLWFQYLVLPFFWIKSGDI